MYGSKADTGQNSLHHQVSEQCARLAAFLLSFSLSLSLSLSTHTQVLDAISGSMMDQGVSIQDVVKKLSSHGFNEKQIRYFAMCVATPLDIVHLYRTAVDFLCNEGHIYSTIDDNHYKSTN